MQPTTDTPSPDAERVGRSVDVREKWNPNSDVALVSFSAFNAIAPNYFHFTRSTDHFDVNKIYLRDSRCAWYHFGLSGISSNIDGTKEYLESTFRRHGIRKRVLIGASSGAYAALLFGYLLEVEDVLALGPRTFLDLGNRWQVGDTRLLGFALRLATSLRAQRKYFDIRNVFRGKPHVKTNISIFYDETDSIDAAHAERIREFPFIDLHGFKGGGHFADLSEESKQILLERLEAALAPRGTKPTIHS